MQYLKTVQLWKQFMLFHFLSQVQTIKFFVNHKHWNWQTPEGLTTVDSVNMTDEEEVVFDDWKLFICFKLESVNSVPCSCLVISIFFSNLISFKIYNLLHWSTNKDDDYVIGVHTVFVRVFQQYGNHGAVRFLCLTALRT